MLALLLTAALNYTLHAKDVFQPPRRPAIEMWTSSGQEQRQSVEFPTVEGVAIRGWLYRSERRDAPYVLFFYGSNEDLAHEAVRLAWLRNALHVNAICFDYPGYGFSGGLVNLDAIRSVVLQEFDYVRDHFAPRNIPIISYGWSIGASQAIHIAVHRPVAGLILQAPPATAEGMIRWSSKHDVPWYGRGIVGIKAAADVQQLYEGAAAIRAVESPLLIIHGERDDVVPIQQGREVYAASPARQKRFVMIPGAHHNDLQFKEAPASDAVADFLRPFEAVE